MTIQDPTIFKLRNGIRVVYLYDDAMVSHLGITVLGGSRYEKEGEEGLAHFLEHNHKDSKPPNIKTVVC